MEPAYQGRPTVHELRGAGCPADAVLGDQEAQRHQVAHGRGDELDRDRVLVGELPVGGGVQVLQRGAAGGRHPDHAPQPVEGQVVTTDGGGPVVAVADADRDIELAGTGRVLGAPHQQLGQDRRRGVDLSVPQHPQAVDLVDQVGQRGGRPGLGSRDERLAQTADVVRPAYACQLRRAPMVVAVLQHHDGRAREEDHADKERRADHHDREVFR